MLWWWGYTEPVSPRPPRLHRISTLNDGDAFWWLTVAFGEQRTCAAEARPQRTLTPRLNAAAVGVATSSGKRVEL
jgi:hypothetical protein